MTDLISLAAVDLFLAALLVFALAGLTVKLQLGLGWQLIVAAFRTTAQLLIVGLILKNRFCRITITVDRIDRVCDVGRSIMGDPGQAKKKVAWCMGF